MLHALVVQKHHFAFDQWAAVAETPYSTDGLVLTHATDTQQTSWKWKPVVTFDLLLDLSPHVAHRHLLFVRAPGALGFAKETWARGHSVRHDHIKYDPPVGSPFEPFVDLPADISENAMSHIVELRWDTMSMAWVFLRLRYDRPFANSQRTAEQLEVAALAPIEQQQIQELFSEFSQLPHYQIFPSS
jgi:hypothetical protein